MKNVYSYNFKLGEMWIAETDGAISHVFFEGRDDLPEYEKKETPLIKKAALQLEEYFAGKRKIFDLPLVFTRGTNFQQEVWKALQTIEYGETKSYKDIATQVGNSQAMRAVGGANNKNPITIIVPCHRVIGANGNMVGFGSGVDKKEFLLNLEKNK